MEFGTEVKGGTWTLCGLLYQLFSLLRATQRVTELALSEVAGLASYSRAQQLTVPAVGELLDA
jgi:hypothetical protein